MDAAGEVRGGAREADAHEADRPVVEDACGGDVIISAGVQRSAETGS